MHKGDWSARLAENEEKLSKKEQELVQWIKENPHQAVFSRLTDLEEQAKVSKPLIISCYKTLGYESYSDFQQGLEEFYAGQIDSYRASTVAFRDVHTVSDLLHSCLSVELAAIKTLERHIMPETLERLAKALLEANNIYIYAAGTGFYPGHYLAQRLRSLGLKAQIFGRDREHVLDDLIPLRQDDLFLSFDYTQDEKILRQILEICVQKKAKSLLVTGGLKPELCRLVQEHVFVPRGSLSFKNSMAVPMAFAQMLLLCIELLGNEKTENALKDLDRFARNQVL